MTGFFGPLAGGWSFSAGVLAIGAVIVGGVVSVLLSFGVYADAVRLKATTQGSMPVLVAPWVWAAATLVGGVIVAGIYWIVHHGLARSSDDRRTDDPTHGGSSEKA